MTTNRFTSPFLCPISRKIGVFSTVNLTISESGLNLGAMGIACSSVSTNFLLLITCLIITWKKLDFNILDLKTDYDFKWLKGWSRIGFFSGLDSLIRNMVYLIVVLRAMNLLDEQGKYISNNCLTTNSA